MNQVGGRDIDPQCRENSVLREIDTDTDRVNNYGGMFKDKLVDVGVALDIVLLNINAVEEEFTFQLTIHTLYSQPSQAEDFLTTSTERHRNRTTEYLDFTPDPNAPDVFQRVYDFRGFVPQISVDCIHMERDHFLTVTNVNKHQGKIWTQLKNIFTAKQFFQLHKFPFDRQDLWVHVKGVNVRIHPWKYEHKALEEAAPERLLTFLKESPNEPILHEDDEASVHRVWATPKGWDVYDIRGIYYQQNVSYVGLDGVGVVIFIERDPWFYGFNYSLVIFFIVATNTCVLGIPIEETADRLGLNVTLLLTLVAFKFVLMQGVPVLTYMTYMDKYVLVSFMVIILGIVESAAIGGVDISNHTEDFDFIFHVSYLSFWFSVHVLVLFCLLCPRIVRSDWKQAIKGTYEEQFRTMETTGKGFDVLSKQYLGL